MKGLFLRYFAGLGLLFLLSTRFIDVSVGSDFGCHPAEIAWRATGLTAERFVLDYWVETRDGEGDLRAVAGEVARRLRLKDPTIFTGSSQGIRFANLDGRLPDGGEVFFTAQATGDRCQMGLSCLYNHLPDNLFLLSQHIRTVFARFGPPGQWSWTVSGRTPGRIEEEAWRMLWHRVLVAVDGVRRDKGEDEYTVTAMSPLLPLPDGAGGNLVIRLAGMRVIVAHPVLGDNL